MWPVYDLLQLYEQKYHKTHLIHEFCAQVSQIMFFAWFDRFTAYYYCLSEKYHETHIFTSFVLQVSEIVFSSWID